MASPHLDLHPVRAPLKKLALPRGRIVGERGYPVFRCTFTNDTGAREILPHEAATMESARGWAQRYAKANGWQRVRVGRYLGGMSLIGKADLLHARDVALRRLDRVLASLDQENAQRVSLGDARSPSDESTDSITPL